MANHQGNANQNHKWGDSLVVQWLALHAFTAGGPGSIPGRRTKIPWGAKRSQKKKKKKKKETKPQWDITLHLSEWLSSGESSKMAEEWDVEITLLPTSTSTCGTTTEHWQKTSDLPKGKKLPTYLGRAKERKKNRQKNRDRTCTSGRELWRGKSFHTVGSPFTGREVWQSGEASEPQRRAQQQGCRGQSGEIPAQRIGAGQHSPAREACLLTHQGGCGLGAEARASEVGSQGEDWGWLREHSLKGLVRHS